METIGLRELNQNPSKAVARVRAGASLIVTDRGKPVLRMVPEAAYSSPLQRMITEGAIQVPFDLAMPDVLIELAPGPHSLGDLLVADRERERSR